MAPGDYSVIFTGTGPNGLITYTQAVVVASPPNPAPMPGVYATLSAVPGVVRGHVDALVAGGARSCGGRPRCWTMYLIGAVYATDADSMPTDAGVIDVFMRATLRADPVHAR